MSILQYTLVVLTVICALLIIWGLLGLHPDGDTGVLSFALICSFLVGFVGWGVLGTGCENRFEYKIVNRSQNPVTLKDNSFILFFIDPNGVETMQSFSKLSDLKLKDQDKYVLAISKNLYGGVIIQYITTDYPKEIEKEVQK